MNRMQAWSGMFAVATQGGLISPDYSLFRPITAANVKYFEYQLKTPILVRQFAQRSRGIGSGFNRLYTPDFGAVFVIAPPLAEQNAIVRYLDYVDGRIGRYIRGKEKLVALLAEEKQAVIHRAVTRGLDANVRLKHSGVEWLGDVPAHWEVRRLKVNTANVVSQTDERRHDEIYLALEHVESWTGRIREPNSNIEFDSQVKRFRAGDVLFGKLRPYLAKVTRPERNGVCVSEFLVLRPSSTTLLPCYLEQLLRSKPIIDVINSSTFGAKMPRADWRFIGNLAVPVPSPAEQAAIAAYLDKATAAIDAAVTRARRQIELMREYRERLIADVVTGKLDVRETAMFFE